ncbi:hypothetical protein BJX63DRAFT_371445 [Aspergillus granulosus]|uniref:RTA1 domain protein n=1 Tax=Aspergillus granulosus TaxID=176169 RepID=A0ABR4H1L9_9EURO
MANGDPVLWSLYVYAPNKIAPIIFAVLYGLSTVGHVWQCYLYKCFRLLGLHPLCGILFTLGYALREYGSFNYLYREEEMTVLITFVLSQVFIYICPPLLELANYHVLGRIFYYVPYHAPLPASRVLSTFGVLMLGVETLNGLGVSLASNPSSSHTTQDLGSHLTIAALSMQFAVILIFVVLAGVFHYRCFKARIRTHVVIVPLRTLYISMTLILIRCIYRLVEHMGSTAIDVDDIEALRALTPVLRYEWFFYVFEATLMLVNSVLWNIWNPGRYLPRSYRVYLSKDGQTEVEGEEVVDERTLWEKVAAVVTLGTCFRREKVRYTNGEELEERRQATNETSSGSGSPLFTSGL